MRKSLQVLFLILITGTVMYAQTIDKPKPNQPVLEIGHPKTTGSFSGGLIGVAAVNDSENHKYAVWCYQYPDGALRHADGRFEQCSDWFEHHKNLLKQVQKKNQGG